MTESVAEKASVFDAYRPLLFSVAYRMLGSVMDAEDMVQETFLRWQQVKGSAPESERAFLTTIVTRLCIDHLRSARVRREQYVGMWLPEPLLTDEDADPAETSVLQESISVAFLVLLEALAPAERACFLLREAFGYDYADIARIVGATEEHSRQLVSRARKRLAEGRPRFAASPSDHERLTDEFRKACADGDTRGFLAILSEDVTIYADGGGKASAAQNPVHGPDRVSRFFVGILQKAPPGLAITSRMINGRPGLVTTLGTQIINAISFEIFDGRIENIYIVVNPDKLQAIGKSLEA
jgi:RNA polymerase sigma-70 factor (ECF subfamily)